MSAPPLAVFDVDGVLADVRHRLRHVEQRPKNWDAFFDAAVDDPPLATGVALAQASAKDCEVVYVTGRPERCRADTLAWFVRHGLPEGTLSMRGARDRRPARIAKLELLRRLDDSNADPVLGELEEIIVDKANQLGIGPMGFGGRTTLLGCKIGKRNRVPASFFVTISYMCWAFRRQGIDLLPDGGIRTWLY